MLTSFPSVVWGFVFVFIRLLTLLNVFFFLFTSKTRLETKLEEFFKENVQASSDRCSALFQDIFSLLEEDLKHGIYFKPGGCLIFMRKIQELKKKYFEEPRKGVQVNKVTCVLGSRPSS